MAGTAMSGPPLDSSRDPAFHEGKGALRWLPSSDQSVGSALRVASALRSKGTPFVLASGGHVDPPPAEFAGVPMIEKPYTIDRVTPIIDAVLSGQVD